MQNNAIISEEIQTSPPKKFYYYTPEGIVVITELYSPLLDVKLPIEDFINNESLLESSDKDQEAALRSFLEELIHLNINES